MDGAGRGFAGSSCSGGDGGSCCPSLFASVPYGSVSDSAWNLLCTGVSRGGGDGEHCEDSGSVGVGDGGRDGGGDIDWSRMRVCWSGLSAIV